MIGRVVATASDAHAMDAYYHLVCYTRLREAALTANRQESKIHSPPFDPIICAQIVAFIEHSEGVFKPSELLEMYQELMSDLIKVIHAKTERSHMLHVIRITFSASYLNGQSFPGRIKEGRISTYLIK